MGTRADFYIGRGESAEWLGSIAWDGYPEGIPENIRAATDTDSYRQCVVDFIASRDDGTKPEMGWPWPWKNSLTTDYAYAFDDGRVWTASFGYKWFIGNGDDADDDDEYDDVKQCVFPDMSTAKHAPAGSNRSGIIVFGFDTPPREGTEG